MARGGDVHRSPRRSAPLLRAHALTHALGGDDLREQRRPDQHDLLRTRLPPTHTATAHHSDGEQHQRLEDVWSRQNGVTVGAASNGSGGRCEPLPGGESCSANGRRVDANKRPGKAADPTGQANNEPTAATAGAGSAKRKRTKTKTDNASDDRNGEDLAPVVLKRQATTMATIEHRAFSSARTRYDPDVIALAHSGNRPRLRGRRGHSARTSEHVCMHAQRAHLPRSTRNARAEATPASKHQRVAARPQGRNTRLSTSASAQAVKPPPSKRRHVYHRGRF